MLEITQSEVGKRGGTWEGIDNGCIGNQVKLRA